MFDSNMVTAICAVLGVIGGLIMSFHHFIQARMPIVEFEIIPKKGFGQETSIMEVVLKPKRIAYPYYIEAVKSSIPIYSSVITTRVTFDESTLSLETPFSLEKPFIVVQSQRFLVNEPQLSFYIDSSLFNNAVHKINIHCRSVHFPFRWGKFITLSV